MKKGKKIAIAVAVILGAGIFVAGVFTKPSSNSSQSDPASYASSQVEKLEQMKQLTTKLYNDEETTDMAQLKSEITQISGSQASLYQGMLSDLEKNKGNIGDTKYNSIKSTLTNSVDASFKKVVSDANNIVANGYDPTPGVTVENYRAALKSMSDAENVISGQNGEQGIDEAQNLQSQQVAQAPQTGEQADGTQVVTTLTGQN